MALKFKGLYRKKERIVKKSGKDKSKMNSIHSLQLLIKNHLKL
jgi:hypothetical protein